MQAVILAGGRGTRLGDLTDTIPKPMVCVNGEPFLEHLIVLLKSYGLTDVLILAGYLGEQIQNYFEDGSKFGLSIQYSFEKELLGTGGALKLAEEKLRKEFLLINGDTYLPIDYAQLISVFHDAGKEGLIVAYENTDYFLASNISVGRSNLVVNYNKNNPLGLTHVDAGAAVFKKKILKFIPANMFCSLEEEIFPKLIKEKQLAAFCTDRKFYDMGSRKGLTIIKEALT